MEKHFVFVYSGIILGINTLGADIYWTTANRWQLLLKHEVSKNKAHESPHKQTKCILKTSEWILILPGQPTLTLQPTVLFKYELLQLPPNDVFKHSLVSNRKGGLVTLLFTLHVTGHVPFIQGVSTPMRNYYNIMWACLLFGSLQKPTGSLINKFHHGKYQNIFRIFWSLICTKQNHFRDAL